jgi:mannose-1-phosphate guanylyltransferase
MKAFLLAAGKGTRLAPMTDSIPKCLVPIAGKPLLLTWIELLEKWDIREVLINTHHFAGQVNTFIDRISNQTKVNITLSHEKTLLGSGGTVFANKQFVDGETDFLIAYADNLTNLNIQNMIHHHMEYKKKGCKLTMGLIRVPNPSACGIAEVNARGKITSFVEKPDHPSDNLANAGIYIASEEIFNFFPKPDEYDEKEVLDFGFHILPRMTDHMYGYEIKEYLRDIGTIESYDRANKEWPGSIA